ncbi:MAG: nuclear transport factor 2 family protein [Acidimicrobiales bacterium]|nr:nuclear transport factor 2 family protein [Acidimicrobiales bacterium]
MTVAPTPREAIHAVLAHYCRGVDRRDRALVEQCFHPDATDDHGTGARDLAPFLDWCFGLLDGYDSTFHILGQSVIDFTDEHHAAVETYGVASHRTAGGPDHRNLVTGFRYLDRFEDRGAGWRIASRTAVTDWSRVDREGEWWAVPDTLLRGRAGPDDASYPQ